MKTKLDISKYRGILFDLDGTLIDSVPIWVGADRETLRHFGATPRDDFEGEVRAFFQAEHNQMKDIFDEYSRYFIEMYGLKNVTVCEYRQVREKIAHARLVQLNYKSNAGLLLTLLKEMRYQLCLVTVGYKNVIDFLTNQNKVLSPNLGTVFGDNIVTSDMVTRKKPNPEAYYVALSRLGLPLNECLVFEDSLEGVTAATKAGLDVCVVHARHADVCRGEIEALTPYHIQSFDEVTVELLNDWE